MNNGLNFLMNSEYQTPPPPPPPPSRPSYVLYCLLELHRWDHYYCCEQERSLSQRIIFLGKNLSCVPFGIFMKHLVANQKGHFELLPNDPVIHRLSICSSSWKPLCPMKSNFIWRLLRMGGTKVCSNSFGHQDGRHAHII